MARTPRLPTSLVVLLLLSPGPGYAQAKDGFVRGLVEVVTTAGGTFGDEGPALVRAIDDMATGLSQWDAAIVRAEAGLGADIGTAPPPTAARMRTALGTIYLERGRLDAALQQFEMATRLDPRFPDVYVLRGIALDAANRSEEAAAAYRVAWSLDRDNPVTAYLAVRVTRDQTTPDSSAASGVLARAAEQRAESLDLEGVRFLTVGLLDDASVPEPGFPPAAYATAFDLLRQGRYEAAVAALREAAAVDPLVTDPALRSDDVRRAVSAVREERATTAIPVLLAAVDGAPASSELHRMLGTAYWSAKQYDRSLEQLRTAIRLNPADERARVAVSDVMAASGDLAGAREAMADALQAVPGSSQALWKLGRLHQALGDGANALRAFTAAAERPLYAGAGHLFRAIGELQRSALDLDAAAAADERRVALDPNDGLAHLDLADVYRAQDRRGQAAHEAAVAALIDPARAGAFAMLGQLRADAGEDGAAVSMLRKAVALDAANLEARYALGRALLRLGRTDEGQEQMKIFAELQAKSLDEQRRRFRENERKIEDALSADERGGAK